jgi:hypothetical protein
VIQYLAFVAIGRISNAMGTSIAPYLDNIFDNIREVLASKRWNLTDILFIPF